MTNEEILQEIGFSKAESIVYLKLLSLGKTKSGLIIKQTSLQSSVVHNALNTLINKGFATSILEGKIKKYSALEPELIEKYIESKKQEFKRILPELQSLKKSAKEETVTTEVYEGYNGLKTATLNLIKNAKKGETFKYFSADDKLLTEEALDFFEKVDILKQQLGIEVKGIANIKHKPKLQDYKYSQIRYISAEIPPAMNIFQDKVLIYNMSDKPIAILIKSKEISKQYHLMWDTLWKIAKK